MSGGGAGAMALEAPEQSRPLHQGLLPPLPGAEVLGALSSPGVLQPMGRHQVQWGWGRVLGGHMPSGSPQEIWEEND